MNVIDARRTRKRTYFGLNELDRKIEKYLDFDKGFFVELGANDGVSQSNTLYFETFRQWSGILIEPTPHNYLKCRNNRASKSTVFCNACVSFEYTDKFVEMAYANLMSIATSLESDIKDPMAHATSGSKFLESTENVFTFGAVAKTLNNILAMGCAPSVIDLMSLDVEGAEIEVLRGINYSEYRFRYMCIESSENSKIESFLSERGYKLVDQLSFHDYLYCSE